MIQPYSIINFGIKNHIVNDKLVQCEVIAKFYYDNNYVISNTLNEKDRMELIDNILKEKIVPASVEVEVRYDGLIGINLLTGMFFNDSLEAVEAIEEHIMIELALEDLDRIIESVYFDKLG